MKVIVILLGLCVLFSFVSILYLMKSANKKEGMMFIEDGDVNYPYTMRRIITTPAEEIFGTQDTVPTPL